MGLQTNNCISSVFVQVLHFLQGDRGPQAAHHQLVFLDDPNPYHYLHASPLTSHDNYGLLTLPNINLGPPTLLGGSYNRVYAQAENQTYMSNNCPQHWNNYTPPSYYVPNKQPEIVGNPSGPLMIPIYVNGILCGGESAAGNREYLSGLLGASFSSVENKSFGFMPDLTKTQMNHSSSTATHSLVSLVNNYETQYTKPHYLFVLHSNGSLVGDSALNILPNRIKDRSVIFAVGPQKMFKYTEYKDAINFIGHRDPVPFISCKNFDYYFSNKENRAMHWKVEPGPSIGHSRIQHSLQHPTYKKPLEEQLEILMNKYQFIK